MIVSRSQEKAEEMLELVNPIEVRKRVFDEKIFHMQNLIHLCQEEVETLRENLKVFFDL